MTDSPLHNVSAPHPPNQSQRTAVAIGNFDGVHRGHQQIFQQLTEYSKRHGVRSVAVTFEPHPIAYFHPEAPPFRLQTIDEKRDVAQQTLDELIAINFQDIASWSASDFFQEWIIKRLNAQCLMVGHNFRFGAGRSADVEQLNKWTDASGIELIVIEDVTQTSGNPPSIISSSAIRDALRLGDLHQVTEMLGRPWSLTGTVIHGDAIGTTLGYPTANIETSSNRLLPPNGIYATYLQIDATHYPSATYIGTRPTFGFSELRVESFVIDAPSNFSIYDAHARIDFIGRIRGDAAFDTPQALVDQMTRDIADARHLLTSSS